VLYRDKECICAACESVWLALEVKNVEYVTVLVDKQNHDDADQLMLPRITWHDDATINAKSTSDPVQLLEQIQRRYPDITPQFYPPLSSAVDASRCNILRLPGVMPRNSDMHLMSLAPYLYRTDGTLVNPSSHTVSLEEVEEMQEEYYLGDFLCGKTITAADLIWAPYLERYAVQLPIVYRNKARLNPRNRNVYGEVDNWYKVMENEVAAYSCRVMGDARHWRQCLEVATRIHNERAVGEEERVCLPNVPEERGWWMKKTKKNKDNNNKAAGEIWSEYCSQRPWLAPTPGGEVALFMMRNRENIVDAAVAALDDCFDSDTADESLREVIQVLLEWDIYFDQSSEEETALPLSERGLRMALFVAEEMIQVPRDLGMIPVGVLWEVIRSCDGIVGESVGSGVGVQAPGAVV